MYWCMMVIAREMRTFDSPMRRIHMVWRYWSVPISEILVRQRPSVLVEVIGVSNPVWVVVPSVVGIVRNHIVDDDWSTIGDDNRSVNFPVVHVIASMHCCDA